jgi:hypothetical protein
VAVALEVGSKRVFASALDWPGWSRGGRGENEALDALLASGPRYRRAMGRTTSGLVVPEGRSGLAISERTKGNATTDFGVPGAVARADHRPLDRAETKRQSAFLRAAWRALDRSAGAAEGRTLATGPRGGGRDLDGIVAHVREADSAYLSKLGGIAPKPGPGDTTEEALAEVRAGLVAVFEARAGGEPPPRTPRSGSVWPPRYAIRRSAWHSLDHAWEIEDRAR